ncbi:MAG TPA: hypothetical protein VK154_12855 [Chitinophagales bacterium]|nr:hypothetical protein [Chitinophagales bacterium]
MNLQVLKAYLQQQLPYQLIFDEIAFTWQVSFVRMVGGKKKDFCCIEQFYAACIMSPNNQTGRYVYESEWIERVDFAGWVDGLKIKMVDEADLHKDIQETLQELTENPAENGEGLEIDVVKLPEKVIRCFDIEESSMPRNPVGWNRAKLAETADDYFYLERHWES